MGSGDSERVVLLSLLSLGSLSLLTLTAIIISKIVNLFVAQPKLSLLEVGHRSLWRSKIVKTVMLGTVDPGSPLHRFHGHSDVLQLITLESRTRDLSRSRVVAKCDLRVHALSQLCSGELMAATLNSQLFQTIKLDESFTSPQSRPKPFKGRCSRAILEVFPGHIAVGEDGGIISIWNIESNQCWLELKGHTATIWCLAMVQGGRQLLSGSEDTTLQLWSLQDKLQLASCTPCSIECKGSKSCAVKQREHTACAICEGHTDIVSCVADVGDGRFASGSWDNTIRLWRHKALEKTMTGHENHVNCLCLLPGKRLVSGSLDWSLLLWNIETGIQLRQLQGHKGNITCIAGLDRGQVITGSTDRTLRVWDLRTGRILHTLEGHQGPVRCILEIQDGRIASCADDGCIKIWGS